MFVPRRRAEGWDTSPQEAALVEEVSAPARGINRAEGWDTSPQEAALVEEVSAPARGIDALAWLRPFTSLLQLDLRHNRLCCLDGIRRMLKATPTLCLAGTAPGRLRPSATGCSGPPQPPVNGHGQSVACLPATLSGVFSPGIEACARLRSIDVRDNLLDDAVSMVAQLGALTRLERIDARHNPFSRHFTGGGNANPDPDPNPAPAPAPAPGTDTHRSLTVPLTLTLTRREPDLRSGRTARRRAVPGAAVLAGAPRLGPARPRRARWPARRRRGAGPRQPAAARLHAAAARARDAGRGRRPPAGGGLEPG